jgi:imidazolonepropionase-like amidohydrolase
MQVPTFGMALLRRAQTGFNAVRDRRLQTIPTPNRGVAFVGTVWAGGSATPELGIVIVDGAGRIAEIRYGLAPHLPHELLILGGERHWVVPGIVDAHVHLGFHPGQSGIGGTGGGTGGGTVGGTASIPVTGLVGVRDLGAPMDWAARWRTGHRAPAPGAPFVAVSGPILTAPGGYPSRSWGGGGYAEFVDSAADGRSRVQHLAAEGVDVIKFALERGGRNWPVLAPDVLRAVVDTAHSLGLPVLAHALTADLVTRALDARVDELVHTPTERLSPELVERIARQSVSVTSTLQTFFSGGSGRLAADNAADLVAAGVRLRYGTDLGNAGTKPGVDPRELDRIADTGLGRLGALRAATEFAAQAPGMRHRTGLLTVGQPAALVLLPFSPLAEPGVWRTPAAVYASGRLTVGQSGSQRRHAGESAAR